MEKERRNNLRRVIHECRKLLEDEISKRLAYYGVMADGSFLDLAKLPHLTSEGWRTRQRIEQAIEKEMLGKLTKSEAVKRYIHHVAFTYLNRLAALRAMEVRGLLKKATILRRDEYGGRSLRERDIAESNPQLSSEQVLKESLIQAFQEVGEEIKVLFDMNNEYSLVFPETRACLELIRLLTEEVTEEDWKEDDVIGWIYQYFNSEARKEFHEARRKPRADDVPVINQFYTPDWIVKALVDNTLGRLWLEMHPDSKIKGFCTYFLPLKEKRPEGEVKRVRDIKVLDPACGSGHFLVYAFDLLYHMYLEDEPDISPSDVPALILENNLFGIDIDLRSVQLAALSLYLKAKTHSRSLKIRRMNLVCADVRIADSERRLEFLKRFQDDPALQHIFARLFEELAYTYEIGSLLKVRVHFERLFQERVSEKDRQARLSLPITGQAKFSVKGLEGQTKFAFNKSQGSSEGPLTLVIPKERTIEEMLDELSSFERESIEAQDMGSLLFATETEKSVGLLSLLSQKYDVEVMNPPYGDMSPKTKEYLRRHYPRTHYDYYAAFIEQAVNLCDLNGYIGMLTGRTFMFLKWFEKVRTEILYQDSKPIILLDLGSGVLEEAIGLWAATVVRRKDSKSVNKEKGKCIFFSLTPFLSEEERVTNFKKALSSWLGNKRHELLFSVKLENLKKLPRMPYSYWFPERLAELFEKNPPLDRDNAGKPETLKIAELKVGLQTGDDERFTRYWWEVSSESIASSREETLHGKKWVPHPKGGDAYYSEILQVVNWENNGEEIKKFPGAVVRNEDCYFKEGLCWSEVVSSAQMDFRILPKGCIFSDEALSLFLQTMTNSLSLLGILNSSLLAVCSLGLDPTMHHRPVGYICQLPISTQALRDNELARLSVVCQGCVRYWHAGDEVSPNFIRPWILLMLGHCYSEKPRSQHPLVQGFMLSNTQNLPIDHGYPEMSINKLAELCTRWEVSLKKSLRETQDQIDERVYDAYGVEEEYRRVAENELKTLRGFPKALKKDYEEAIKPSIAAEEHLDRLLSYYVKRALEEDSDGIVPLDEMFPDNLIKKIHQLIGEDFGTDQVERVEQELHQLLGVTLKDWLAQRYFDFHVSLYKNRPIFWQLSSYEHGRSRGPPGVFSCFVHYHRLTRDTIPKIRAFYLDRVKEALTREKEHLLRVLEAARATGDGPRINGLSKVYEETLNKIKELERFEIALTTVHNARKDKKVLTKKSKWVDKAIAEVRDNGWNPIIDYGVRVNIEPLKEAKLLHPAAERVR